MNEYREWDRAALHLPMMASAIHRELQGLGPEIINYPEKQLRGRITKVIDEGRSLSVATESGEEISLRVGGLVDIEGVPNRTQFKVGMRLRALYEQQKEWNEALEVRVEP
jgi:hypothetical protein